MCIVSKDAGMKNLRIPFGMGVVGRAAETGELILVNDTRASEHFSPTMDRISGYQTRNLLTCPIKDNHGEVAAVIQVRGVPASSSGGLLHQLHRNAFFLTRIVNWNCDGGARAVIVFLTLTQQLQPQSANIFHV